jgi:hypothetical protein
MRPNMMNMLVFHRLFEAHRCSLVSPISVQDENWFLLSRRENFYVSTA